MSNWISTNDALPGKDQRVWYHSPQVGTWRGKFDVEGFTFYGEGGFLDGYDVSHWMPDTGQEKPTRP